MLDCSIIIRSYNEEQLVETEGAPARAILQQAAFEQDQKKIHL